MMNIKGLLFGSAAALVAVSGARAADAVVMPEPEPMEYVRVCDVYGAGFYYIPGTETCLQISGEVWYEMGATSDNGLTDTPNYYGYAPDGWNKMTHARVNFDVRSETEWGTLRGYIRLQSEWGLPGDGAVEADQAWLALGGLRMGYTESAWVESFKGGVAAYGSHSWGGLYYGDQQRHQISYSFGSEEAFAATLSLEDDALAGDGYVPDVVAVLSYNQAWGGVWAKFGYDEDRTIVGTTPVGEIGDSGFGAQVGLQYNIGADGSSLRLLAFYADSDNAYSTGSALGVAPEWSALASYYHQFTPNFGASVGFQYFSNLYAAGSNLSTDVDAFAVELSTVWTPVENFEVRAEGVYDKVDASEGTVSGFLRFTRYF